MIEVNILEDDRLAMELSTGNLKIKTSKCDHLVLEEMKHHDKYAGKRIKRGLFKSSTGKVLNADINGAIGILRKGNAITDEQLMLLRDRGDVVSPLMLEITHKLKS